MDRPGSAPGRDAGYTLPVDTMLRTNWDTTIMRKRDTNSQPMHRPPTLMLVQETMVDAGPLTSMSEGGWHGHTPSSTSELTYLHHNSLSTGPATITNDKMPPMEPTMMRPGFCPDSHTGMPPFMGTFDDWSGVLYQRYVLLSHNAGARNGGAWDAGKFRSWKHDFATVWPVEGAEMGDMESSLVLTNESVT